VTAADRERAGPPEPSVLPEDEPSWQDIEAGRISLVKCDACGAWSGFARSCVACGAREYSWHPASGLGVVRSFVVFHRPYHPYFATQLPYNVAVIELDEGPEMVTNVVDVPPEEIEIGMKVRLVARKIGEHSIPQAAPAD
jgi:hypothetical protein